MSRLTIPKNPFQALDHDYTRLHFSFPIGIQGHITQKPNFPLPQVSPIWLILFPWLGQPEPFWVKSPKTNPNLIKTLSFDRNITWTISDPKEPVKIVHFVATYQVNVPLQLGFLNKKKKEKWKNGKRIMIFPSCIWDI